jgi:hypothetical protein
MSKSVSLLIGAGFSAPMGYPIGNKLNMTLLNEDGKHFSFHTKGTLVTTEDGKKPNAPCSTSYDISFEFCRALIQYFNKENGYFDYEEFYDFIKSDAYKQPAVIALAKPFLKSFARDVEQLFFSVDNVYVQVVSFYIKDKDGRKWYDDEPHACKPIFPEYTGFLYTVEALSKTQDSIDIHTLNHDLFLESLNHSDWISGNLCDGFEELGSSYFGELTVKDRNYKCRLEHYTGKYATKCKLYKLHGSFDYVAYYKSDRGMMVPETYIKSRFGIGVDDLYKEVREENGGLAYERCHVNYHSDFLTGTTSKIERYQEPLLFKKLFQLFRENLKNADSLIIVGYGCKDSEVNKMILENFDFKKKKSFIVDPFAGNQVKAFADQLGAKISGKTLDNLSIADVQ